MSDTLSLIISPKGEYITILWLCSIGPNIKIDVNRTQLLDTAALVRHKANIFVQKWIELETRGINFLLNEWIKEPILSGSLAAMICAGKNLFNLIMPPKEFKKINARINTYKRVHISFVNISEISVPWGLCYGSDVKDNIIDHFWGNKFLISVEAAQVNSSTHKSILDKGAFFPLLSWLERQNIKNGFEGSELTFANEIYELSPQMPKDENHFSTIICKLHEEIKGENILYYVYSHVNKDSHEMGIKESDSLSVGNFASVFENTEDEINKKVFFFLNGCNTNNDHVIQHLISDKDRCLGCLVTETEMPKRFAMRYGMEFIDRWLQRGETLVDVLLKTRSKHLPFSLFYTLYSNTNFMNFQFNPKVNIVDESEQKEYRTQVENINFSTDRVTYI